MIEFIKRVNPILCIAPTLLFSIGYITLLSTSAQRAYTNFGFFIIGIFIFVVLSIIDFRILKYFTNYIYFFSLLFLMLTFLIGETKLGSARWLNIFGLTFQPSELGKFSVLICMATDLAKHSLSSLNFKNALKLFSKYLLIVALIIAQPDLGSAVSILFLIIALLFFAGVPLIFFVIFSTLMGLVSPLIWSILHDYQRFRILVFINPAIDVLGRGYNVIQSIISIGSGGIFGKGFGYGSQAHLSFLPIYWTDFIFAAFAEEWGFIGIIILLLFFVLFLGSILYIALKSTSSYGYLLCLGAFSLLFFQFFINVGMNLGLLPVTGIPLPLISYGGTSIIVTMAILGVVHSVWLHRL